MAEFPMVVLVLLAVAASDVRNVNGHIWPSIKQKLSQDRDLSQFFALVQNNKLARAAFTYRELTVFAPTNAAFEKFQGSIGDDLVLYHLVPMARTLENLQDGGLDPILEKHPPLWVTVDENKLYVNNARILRNASDYLIRSRTDQYGRSQVLHVIDKVLSPMADTASSPSAYDLLVQPNLWKSIPFTFHVFYKRVMRYRLQYGFKGERLSGTYFLPVDQFMDRNAESQIDREIIDMHIIPNRVIFSRTAIDEFAYVTRGRDHDFFSTVEFLGDSLVRLSRRHNGTQRKVGEKLVQILQANIPVRNGVVHVVRDVFGLFEKRLTKFPYLPVTSKLQTDPHLNITEYLFRMGGLTKVLDVDNINFTLFLPTDNAWRKLSNSHHLNLSNLDVPLFHERAQKVIRRHIVVGQYYPLKLLLEITKNLRGSEVMLDVGSENILIKVLEHNGKAYVRWGNKDIPITKADYECSNGIVHLIDYPLVFDHEIKGLGVDDEYMSLLYKSWNVIKKVLV